MRALLTLLLVLNLALAAPPVAAQTQNADRDFLTAFLEDNLSDAGRRVTIIGFHGALSSIATMDVMTIADADGIWITLRDVSLNWDRAALLSGKVIINTLTAAEVILDRKPVVQGNSGRPAAEGAPFSLPELPVSVNIGRVAIDRIVLGRDVLGEVVAGSAEAALSLAGGEGKALLNLNRNDTGPDGYLTLEASYSNVSSVLTLSIEAREDAGGVAVRLLSVPGAPSAGLTIQGSGPLDGFLADVALKTDGQPRLSGQIVLTGRDEGRRDFSANLSGDMAPVFWPAYREFLGSELNLKATGSTYPDGRLEVSDFTLTSGALRAKGNLALAADGLPESFNLGLLIASPDSTPLMLPLTTEIPTRITSASLQLGFDAKQGQDWTVDGMISGLDRVDFKAENLILSGGGTISAPPGLARISTDLSFIALGFAATDPGLAAALGKTASGKLTAQWVSGSGKTHVSDLSFVGEDYQFNAIGDIQGLSSGFAIDGSVTGRWQNLSRLSALTGLPLGGSADLTVTGTTSALGRAFDVELTAKGQDLTIDQTEIDNLLAGTSEIKGEVARDATGTSLRAMRISAGTGAADITGKFTSDTTDLQGTLELPNLSVLGAGYRGRVRGQASFTGTTADGQFSLIGTADGLGIGQTHVDRILAGPTDLSLSIAVKDRIPFLENAMLNGQSIDLTAKGQPDGGTFLAVRLADLALIVPQFSGPLTLSGPIYQSPEGLSLSLRATGPARVAGNLTGRIDAGFAHADLTFSGQSLADVFNPFLTPRALSGTLSYDLRFVGPLNLNALSGRVSLSGGRLADPALNFGFDGIEAVARISGGQAEISATSKVTSGGSFVVAGRSSLTLPYPGFLTVKVRNVVLRDPKLYTTTANGQLSVDGPLAGGALVKGHIALGRTELRIPSSGLGGSEPIPEITHLSESAAVRETRARAGLIGKTTPDRAANLADFALDIKVTAPNQIFLRGRGLDAELGGSLRLRGTSNDLRPEGSFDLIRGRLDIVGRRLVLSEAQILLEGAFVPRINILATTEGDDSISTLRISGPALDPVLTLASSPALPQEEVLAQLLFGERLQTLSTFQAIQLATAVRTLVGKGGEGLIGNLRNKTGLDNLDIKTDETGTKGVSAGKYLSEKIYSEVSIDQTGKTQIDLNLDIQPHITLKAKASSDGDTGVGLFLERNY